MYIKCATGNGQHTGNITQKLEKITVNSGSFQTNGKLTIKSCNIIMGHYFISQLLLVISCWLGYVTSTCPYT
jgi:hypothetical protein